MNGLKRLLSTVANSFYQYDNLVEIQVDDGEGPYLISYAKLVEDLMLECDIVERQNSWGAIWKHANLSEDIVINNIKCNISFKSKSFCAKIIDDKVKKIDCKDIDYQPNGGFTSPWYFDCSHHSDIVLFPDRKSKPFPYKPPAIVYDDDHKPSFKTKKFVLNELEQITESINRYIELRMKGKLK